MIDCLEIPDKLRPFVNDYKIHVFDIAFLTEEQVNLFKSDFKIVADYFVQVRKNKEYIPSKEQIQHVDAMLKLMSVLTNDNRFYEKLYEKGQVHTMCEVLDQAEARGKAEGKTEGESLKVIGLVQKKLEKQLDVATIAEHLEEPIPFIEEIVALIQQHTGATAEQIYELHKKEK